MKVLVIYATKGGVSRRCCEILTEKLQGSMEITLCDINNTPPVPNDFDVAVIGGSVRMGSINKKLKAYLKNNAEALNQINTALFLCCGFSENFDDYVSMQIPKSVIPSLGIHFFGGELKPEKLKGIDKLIVKMVRSSLKSEDFEHPDPDRSPLPEIIPENIIRLADKIRTLL